MSYLIKPIKPAMFYAFSRILVWFSELVSALQGCHDMAKFSISDWPCEKDTTIVMGILSKFIFYCQSNGCPFLCAICYFHAKTINMYSTINHTKACFKNYTRSTGQAIQPFLVIVAFLMAVAVCLFPFMTAGGARCVLFIVNFWLGMGWTWASNIYVHGIH